MNYLSSCFHAAIGVGFILGAAGHFYLAWCLWPQRLDTVGDNHHPGDLISLGNRENVGLYGVAEGPGCIMRNGVIVWCRGAEGSEGR